MTRVLITAFEPYDRWPENSSWSALVDLTNWYDGVAEITTRRYAVDLTRMSQNLRKDLQEDYDIAIHLGQSPGHPLIKLEAVGLNVRSDGSPLVPGAPEAYRSSLPLGRACKKLLDAGIPSEVSHHAGTYLCNAALFLSQHYAQSFGMKTRSAFVHIPLAPAQAAQNPDARLPSMSTPMSSAAIAIIVDQFAMAG
ncbi:Pyrrolidone-carboxylate peptidase [Rubripirellula lacrimiformis]|uniref:Pyrrolidone-carboxylate peptidase n=1 Tax=Rubripirellula lacrimiformis TaxID=1930273 RepID=A0A517NB12_9BACT|nr:pyroglutamyl-peptidase I [Rubripirellula lacrimiformis]QDT04321.1 Pyrrolidone-carboxylate peptidase [Rubripirellula lacrimiformis]